VSANPYGSLAGRSLSVDSPQESIDDLDAAICTLARSLNAETQRLLTLVRRFDDRMGWAKWSFRNCAEWLAWRWGLSLSAAHERVRIAHALRDLPAIASAFADGRLSYTKVRALTRVAANHDSDALLDYALRSTAAQVGERCRQLRNAETEASSVAQRAWKRRSLTLWRDAARNVMAIRVEVPLEEGELIAQALNRAVAAGEAATGIEFNTGTPDEIHETTGDSWRAQQADALVAVVKAYQAAASPQRRASARTQRRPPIAIKSCCTSTIQPSVEGAAERTCLSKP
jgi:hypothetical protein